MHARMTLAALAVAMSLGCSSSGTNASAAGAARAPSRSRDVIGQEEIAARAGDATNALQIVEKLRPQMLRSRGASSPSDMSGSESAPRVYVDNVSYGPLDALSNVLASQIKEIRFVNAGDATTQWGTGHTGGVILVITKK
jgi:TonB-dependent receptor-like protein